MNKGEPAAKPVSAWWRFPAAIITYPLWAVAWPFVTGARGLYRHFLSYIFSAVLRKNQRIYSVKFVWYHDSIYFHPMIWGSLILWLVARGGWLASGWLLMLWFIALFVCYMTIMYNFNIVRAAILAVGIVAILGVAYFSTVEFAWNPLRAVSSHVKALEAGTTPGFYVVSAYFFALLIAGEVAWAWLFHRVEIDESYVYEHAFMQGTSREPIFARGLKRETKDLLELLVLGAGDISHRTKNGFKRFENVPFASLWLGKAIDDMLDYHRQAELTGRSRDDDDDQVRVEDAHHGDEGAHVREDHDQHAHGGAGGDGLADEDQDT